MINSTCGHSPEAHVGTALKANPLEVLPMQREFCRKKVGVEARQPNSAIKEVCQGPADQEWQKKPIAFVPNDGCSNFIEESDEVLVAGFGHKGHAVGDVPGVCFKVVKGTNVSLLALYKDRKGRPRS
ncbi:small ribosomal subunit protein uS12-like [Mirounga angustirostris]|uniref:small ribosomal subunit protein uS12-like n=1 Tax=Mirounga angustirostris TaxID=9716 RepID=UPI001E68BC6F|nr:40S ribosomal protein S23-like [Mirounga angustirostris]